MKHRKSFTIAAALAVFALAAGLLACSNGNNSTGGKPPVVQQGKVTYTSSATDGTEYKLVITEKAGRYVQQTGDTYVLTVTKDGEVISTTSGTITIAVTGAAVTTITLSGGTDLTVTISTSGTNGGDMTDISGTIEDESETIEAPGPVTPEDPPAPPPDVDGDDDNQNALHFVEMNGYPGANEYQFIPIIDRDIYVYRGDQPTLKIPVLRMGTTWMTTGIDTMDISRIEAWGNESDGEAKVLLAIGTVTSISDSRITVHWTPWIYD